MYYDIVSKSQLVLPPSDASFSLPLALTSPKATVIDALSLFYQITH
jgi:hypothetical protein